MEGVEAVVRGPFGAPLAKASGDRDDSALLGAGGRGSSPPNLELVVFADQNTALELGDPGQVTPQPSNFTCGMKLGVVAGIRWWSGVPLRGLRGYLIQNYQMQTEAQRREGLDQGL